MEKEGQGKDDRQPQTEDMKSNGRGTAKEETGLQKPEKEEIITVLFCFVGKIGC